MKQTDLELRELREDVNEMWKLVLSQMEKTKEAFLTNNRDLAYEVISREKRVNAFDSKIDSDSENYIALYAPVAVDLRLVLSTIKISSTLERIADFADGIARQVISEEFHRLDNAILEELKIDQMFDIVISMLYDSYAALNSENTKIAGKILATDDQIDKLYHQSMGILANFIKDNLSQTIDALKTMIIIRKLERIGDHCCNIVEEIVFYIDAKVLKHKKPQQNSAEEV